MAIEGLQIAHAMPGRIRLKVDKVKGNPAFAQKVVDTFGQAPGMTRVEANPVTGSVLLEYDAAALLASGTLLALMDGFAELFPEIDPRTLEMGFDELMKYLASSDNAAPAGGLAQSVAAINTDLARLTGGFDLKLLIPLGLLLLGVRSLYSNRNATVPAWHDYLWFAFSTFFMLNRGTFDKPQE